MNNSPPTLRPPAPTSALQLYVILGGAISLLGWILNIPRFTDWLGNGISIQPNTTIAVMTAGMALAFLSRGYRVIPRILGILLITIGGSALFQIATRVNLGIDTLLMFDRDWGRGGVLSPGRMGPTGATSWTLLGIGFVLATFPRGTFARRFAPALPTITASIATLSLLGYFYGVNTLYSLPHTTVIAFQTATFIFAVSLGFIFSVPEHGLMLMLGDPHSGGVFARRMMPTIFLVPILLGFFQIIGERQGLHDSAFGSALRTVAEIIFFMLFVWIISSALSNHAKRRAEVTEALRVSRQELRELLESERAARTSAEHAARLKDDFLATLSHELRTPLHAVIGWAQILKKDLLQPDKARAAAEIIERNARLQAQLITDLLDISRIVSGNMRLELQAVDLSAVVEAAIESIMPEAQAKGVQIRRAIEPVPNSAQGDPARLQQVVWNLLSNAVKFTPAGGSVRVALTERGSRAEICVADTGQGIAPEFLPHVFKRFRQADPSPSRSHGGLGIGLAIVKQLVELHGGHIRVESGGIGKGTTFTIEVPLRAQVLLVSEPQVEEDIEALRALAGVCILAIDDEADGLAMMRRILEDQGARVETALSAGAALDLLEAHTFDILVSDIGMPGQDGYEFISAVRQRGIETPALALTAFARPEDRVKVMRSGYQAHTSKPVDASELVITLSSLLATRPTSATFST